MARNAVARNNVTTLGRADGPVLLFAHGFGCDQNMWRRIIGAFTDGYRVVLFDHVGAGGSDLDAYDHATYASLDAYARDIVEICDEMALTEVTLVGHSVSAMIGAFAVAQRPDLFARLVMVSPSPRFIDDRDYTGGFTEEDIDGLLESLDSNYFGWAANMAPMVMGDAQPAALQEELTVSFCRTRPDIAYDFARVTFLSDARDVLTEVPTPTLVLQCTNDLLAAVEVGEYVHAQLPHSRFVLLAATGHCPHVSAPDETAAAIHAFLADV
ncbi:alpha/beta fold hydrolase [Nakamurella deserti]|uniref:alpha/beta fold hydrolase n=1 Tax=Nakamurella deserti TaxID=2164074 RepID=UPI000DBE4301|nr:alpha/beta hydrolase [Nakamurella deserti]